MGEMFIPPASTGEMFIPPDTSLTAANYALTRNATFSTNLDEKQRVYLEQHSGDVTRVPPRYAGAGTLRSRHNRHHAVLGTQYTNLLLLLLYYTQPIYYYYE